MKGTVYFTHENPGRSPRYLLCIPMTGKDEGKILAIASLEVVCADSKTMINTHRPEIVNEVPWGAEHVSKVNVPRKLYNRAMRIIRDTAELEELIESICLT